MRWMLSVVILGLSAMPLSSDANCGNAYVAFVDGLSGRPDARSADRLATIHRSALRILDACDSGHIDNPDTKFRDLEKSLAAMIAS